MASETSRPVNPVTSGFFIAWGAAMIAAERIGGLEPVYFLIGVAIVAVGIFSLTPWGARLR